MGGAWSFWYREVRIRIFFLARDVGHVAHETMELMKIRY